MAVNTNKLTPKQQLFVKEYLIDLNASQAAIRAGYSERTSREMGYELLTKPHVQEALQQAQKKREKRTNITADRVLEQLARVAFSDIGEFVEFDGTTVTIKSSKDVDGTVLSEVSATPAGLKIKLNDKMKALELLGRHLGMFNDKLNISVRSQEQEAGGVNSLRELKNKQPEQLPEPEIEIEQQNPVPEP